MAQTKWLKLSKRRALEVARLLKKARLLMNDGGAHWIQGALVRGTGKHTKYCSIGGLTASVDRRGKNVTQVVNDVVGVTIKTGLSPTKQNILRDATILLAETINGGPILAIPGDIWGEGETALQVAEETIIEFNDGCEGWEDVEYAFKRAENIARKLAEGRRPRR